MTGCNPVLLYLFAGRGGWLGSPVLPDYEGLIGVKRTPAGVPEYFRHCADRVTLGSTLNRENETGLLTFAEIVWYQVSGGRPRLTAGRRPELGQRSGIPAELRVILRLRGMNRLDLTDRGRFLGVHTVLIQLGGGDGSQDENDRYHDQELNKREATAVSSTIRYHI